ncbi:Retrovirus-related Pol polyprotein from transposon 17.6 [Vitis vinifera]|uniref:RNA-directed DNA polymerase n=1 Tax=Vitis vinifera TaxID=29760 RepID=A0A438FWS4_VITVI|nr:Retrovirus-related Pol polyprotein from transposon 17.6 [Vitis vinifera]
MQNDLSQKIDNIQYSISRLTNLNTVNEKGKFPSQPSQNPRVFMKLKPKRGIFKVEGGQSCDHLEEWKGESNNQEERVGRKVHPNQALKKSRIVIKEDMMKKHMPPPFPQALHGKKEIKNSSEILEVLRQVKVNIPLLDMIKQVPTYAKFLKDLCTVKRGLHVTKNAFLTEQGVIEDVLVQVDKFYYPVDFVVLDTDPTVKEANYVPIILGRPFLATSNAIINCRNGVMQLTFGNMTLELNIFHLCKRHLHPEEEEGLEEVCLINTLVEEHCDKNLEESLNESLEVFEEGLPEPSDVLAIMSPWRRREEILPLFNKEDSQGAAMEDPPKLVLKPLPGLAFGVHPPYLHGGRCKTSEAAPEELVGEPHPSSPKKSGITVIQNEKGEEVSTRPTSGWRVCIDYRRLNSVTRKDHFPLPFMDQVLERVSGHPFYCFLDGYSGCMLSIFSDMVERIMEVFMDDITVYGSSFEECLLHLEAVLHRCIGRRPSAKLGEVPFYGIRQFLGHAGFYRRFIKDFSKISKPLCELLVKDAKFVWDEKCQKSFEELKQFLTTAPIVRAPNWKLPFEVMCDASDLAMGAVLGQREDGKPYVIYYASKTLNEAQRNYTTTEKELLAVVFALDKFRAYLVGSSIVVFTDHSALKYLLTKQDAKARLIRWILLLQEFNLQIRDKKGVENVVADHLSRLVIAHDSHGLPINDDFPEESLMSIDVAPWYSHIANYLVTGKFQASGVPKTRGISLLRSMPIIGRSLFSSNIVRIKS